MKWISVKDRLPKEFETVLTQHVEDLYPVSAFYMINIDRKIWMREIEGPEDIIENGRCGELYRSPTHWMPLPDPPKESK